MINCSYIIVLINTGFEVHPSSMPSQFRMKAFTICGCFDLPARASVLNVTQFNGQYGCNFCEQSGCSYRTEKGGHVHTFPYISSSPKGPPKTHHGYIEHAKAAARQKSVVCIYVKYKFYTNAIAIDIAMICFIGVWCKRANLAELLEVF